MVKVDENSYKAHYQLGIAYIEKQDFKEAFESLKQALKINSKQGQTYKAIGHIFYENENPTNATKYYKLALQCDGLDVESKIGLANCYYLMEKYEDAIKLYEEISAIDMNDEIEYNLGNCYYMKGEIEESILRYNNALRLNPNKPDCLYNLGNAYCIKERFQEALSTFQSIYFIILYIYILFLL